MRRPLIALAALPVLALGGLTGCSTMSDIGKGVGNTLSSLMPFGGGSGGSGAPYVGDIDPTVPKAAPEVARSRSGGGTGPEPAQSVPYSTEPGAVEQDAKPTARGSDSRRSDAAPSSLNGAQFAEAATPPAAEHKPTPEEKAGALDQTRRHFQDDGRYPNLSGVPARPTDLPSAKEIENRLKSMQDERGQALARSIRPVGEPPEAIPEVTPTSPGRPAGPVQAPGQPDAVAIEPFNQPASPATAIPAPRPDGSPRTEVQPKTLIV